MDLIETLNCLLKQGDISSRNVQDRLDKKAKPYPKSSTVLN